MFRRAAEEPASRWSRARRPLDVDQAAGQGEAGHSAHLGLGTLHLKLGQQEQARAALSTAIDLYRTMDMTFWLPQAEAMLAQVKDRFGGET